MVSIYMLMQSINSVYEKVFCRALCVASWDKKEMLPLDVVAMYQEVGTPAPDDCLPKGCSYF